ncbi:hypothetical protein GCM10009080_27190 [Cupriavidus pauculus]
MGADVDMVSIEERGKYGAFMGRAGHGLPDLAFSATIAALA